MCCVRWCVLPGATWQKIGEFWSSLQDDRDKAVKCALVPPQHSPNQHDTLTHDTTHAHTTHDTRHTTHDTRHDTQDRALTKYVNTPFLVVQQDLTEAEVRPCPIRRGL